MEYLERVPMVCLNCDNIDSFLPSLNLSVKTASFVAVDLELSGLGDRKIFSTKSIEDRYKTLAEVAKTRAIISVGISCFRVQNEDVSGGNFTPVGPNNCKYFAQNYDILVLCSEEYTVEPASLKFLVDHGFDFNHQYAKGIQFYRGNDQKEESMPLLRQLFGKIVVSQKPVVLHNGFVDLLFLYHSLYCSLPNNLATFLADLSEMFPGGVYDTKYIAEFHAHLPASYLEYVFRKRQRALASLGVKAKTAISLHFPTYIEASPWIQYRNCQTCSSPATTETTKVCPSFADHGWCKLGKLCMKSHNVDDILNAEDRKRKKRRRKSSVNKPQEEVMDQDFGNSHIQDCAQLISVEQAGRQISPGHRAGYDAFMTGFIFASFVDIPCFDRAGNSSSQDKVLPQFHDFANKIYMCGKDVPLLIMASAFSKFSPFHREKLARLQSLHSP